MSGGPASGPAIEVRDLSKTYRVHRRPPGLVASLRSFFWRDDTDVSAVADLDFTIPAGEIVGLLGPNGAGKTTVMKVLCGLLYPTKGEVLVSGFRPFERAPDFLRRISMVFGNRSSLSWDLSAGDGFLVRKAIYEIDDAAFDRRLERFVSVLGAGGVLDKPVRQLSLGERMKCELIASLLHGPEVLFLDEPTLGLDINTQSSLRAFIQSYARETGATIILSSHYMADISSLAERILLIDQGTLRFDGSVAAFAQLAPAETIVTAKLRTPSSRPVVEALGRVRFIRSNEVQFSAPRETAAELARRVMAELDAHDIALSELPLDEVLTRSFETSTVGAEAS